MQKKRGYDKKGQLMEAAQPAKPVAAGGKKTFFIVSLVAVVLSAVLLLASFRFDNALYSYGGSIVFGLAALVLSIFALKRQQVKVGAWVVVGVAVLLILFQVGIAVFLATGRLVVR